MRFQNASGSNLQRNKLNHPDDFEGELNVVMVAFQQWQQSHIDTWWTWPYEMRKCGKK